MPPEATAGGPKPYAFSAYTLTLTSVPQGKLCGSALRIAIGIEQNLEPNTIGFEPSQYESSRFNTSLDYTTISLYAVIVDPLSYGVVHVTSTFMPLIEVVAGDGASGT